MKWRKIDVMRRKQRKVKRPAVTGSWTQDTSDLSRQCSATELWQPDNHQPSIGTALVVLNASVAHLAVTQYVLSELCYGLTGKFCPSGKNSCWVHGFLTWNAQSILPYTRNKGIYEAKIEWSKKASSHQELNPGHFWLEPPVLCHWTPAL